MKGKYIVSGGAGFIGSHLVEILLESNSEVIVLDNLTYATKQWIRPANPLLTLIECDIANRSQITKTFQSISESVDLSKYSIFHLAAETHVDRSITNPAKFVESNVLGTQFLLQAFEENSMKRFLHVSTDEVYGSLEKESAKENFSLNPSSPYAASKAASDLIVLAHQKTFGINALVTRCVNNFGPRQNLEKFIPRLISRIILGEKIPIYGSGLNVREWIYVRDHCKYLLSLMLNGKNGEIYNIGTGMRFTNLDLVTKISKLMHVNPGIRYVRDRLGHDLRYALDSSKLLKNFNNVKISNFDSAMTETINYYLNYSNTTKYRLELEVTENFYAD